MLIKRNIFCIISLTILGLCYVYQQTKIVELGYYVKEQEELLSQLLDQNSILVYNINTLSSPLNLDEQLLSKRFDLSFVKGHRLVRLASVEPAENMQGLERPMLNFIFDLFIPKAQAEAGTVKAKLP